MHTRNTLKQLAFFALMAMAASCGDEVEVATTEAVVAEPLACDPDGGPILFEQRIAPLLAEDNPPSCGQCHLAGTKLSQFIKGTPCEAMACLEAEGLVDLERPMDSTILAWIARGQGPENPENARLATREREAFVEWIEWASECQVETCGYIAQPCGVPRPELACSDDDHEACGVDLEDRDLSSGWACDERGMATAFHALVMPWRNRCAHCHAPSGSLADVGDPPHWLDDLKDEDASLRTMRRVVDSGLIDLEAPGRSLLLTKPLWESQGGVPHGGGDKFAGPSDRTYREFLLWAVTYARCAPVPPDPTLAP